MPNALNPFAFWTASAQAAAAWQGAALRAMTPVVPTTKPAAPLDIEAAASDKGLRIETGPDSVTLRGVASGPEVARDIFGLPVGDYARGVRVGVDVDTAPTTDAFGRTSYAAKNRRSQVVITSAGATAAQVAQRLVDKFNEAGDYRARLERLPDGAAKITFERR
jgi:hypothetical protein